MALVEVKHKPVNGILLLNKPQGITSNAALQKAKRLFFAKKAGHTGSLDPLATGMLPICFGEATKLCDYLLCADKCYQTTGCLGIKTDTADSTGQVTHQVHEFTVTKCELELALEQYKGTIKQIPSMFSALKHKGKPLYSYARQGTVVERQARAISIQQLTLTALTEHSFSLTVLCSKGTYIRNLVEDIGDSLHVGAHVIELHRLYTAGFEHSRMYTLAELELMTEDERHDCLVPMDSAVSHLKPLYLLEEEVRLLRQGRVLIARLEHDNMTINTLRLYDEQGTFIGLGESLSNGDVKTKRLLSFEL
jgi:tRNA pseudouridine55 synthase